MSLTLTGIADYGPHINGQGLPVDLLSSSEPSGRRHAGGGPLFAPGRCGKVPQARKVGTQTAMAFAIRDLSVLAYANGFTLWHYKAGKARLEEVGARNFFAGAADMLAAGDMVMVSAADGARVLCVASPSVAGTIDLVRLA